LGLQDYILHAERVDLISMNKEGIFSLLGYAAIFFIGVDIGTYLMKRKPISDWYSIIRTLLIIDIVLWIFMFLLSYIGIEPSRRLV